MSIKKNKKNLRVLNCPIPALYQPYYYVKGLREIGFQADYMAHNFAPFSSFGRDCDFDLELNGIRGLSIEKSRELDFFAYAIENYDVFHFHSGYGLFNSGFNLWERLNELSFLKKLGKKLVMSWWGCGDLFTDELIENRYSPPCRWCSPDIKNYCRSLEKKDIVNKAFELIDLHLSSGDIVALYRQGKIRWIDNAIDCNEFHPIEYIDIPKEFRLPKTEKFRIYHSFGNSTDRGDVKGTSVIVDTIKKLIENEYAVELIYFDKIPNKYIKFYQAQADIVVDQLRAGWHGSTAVECLAMGKPVITYIRSEVEKIAPHEYPLINANPDNLYEVLKDLLDNPERINKIGSESRKYALTYHHYINVAKKLGTFYSAI